MLCHDCGATIDEGRSPNQPPTEAKYCFRCRSGRRRRTNLKYAWKPEYDEYLKAHYHGGLNRRFQVLNRMIRETGLPRWYIKRRAARLGLTMHHDKRPWTTAEESILQHLLGKVSALTIARRLKRTEASVVLKIKRFGVSRRVSSGYTMRDLEQCLGESHHKIQQWIGNGWLRDRLQGTRRHDRNGCDIHRIQEKDILKFIRDHPLEIHLDRVEALWFLDLVLLKGKEMSDTRNRSRRGVDDEAA